MAYPHVFCLGFCCVRPSCSQPVAVVSCSSFLLLMFLLLFLLFCRSSAVIGMCWCSCRGALFLLCSWACLLEGFVWSLLSRETVGLVGAFIGQSCVRRSSTPRSLVCTRRGTELVQVLRLWEVQHLANLSQPIRMPCHKALPKLSFCGGAPATKVRPWLWHQCTVAPDSTGMSGGNSSTGKDSLYAQGYERALEHGRNPVLRTVKSQNAPLGCPPYLPLGNSISTQTLIQQDQVLGIRGIEHHL